MYRGKNWKPGQDLAEEFEKKFKISSANSSRYLEFFQVKRI